MLQRHGAIVDRYSSMADLEEDWAPHKEHERWRRMDQESGPHPFEMYVFTVLDNVEYVIHKYRRGYIEDALVEKTIKDIQSRCGSHLFNRVVRFWSIESYSYGETTRGVFRRACPIPLYKINGRLGHI